MGQEYRLTGRSLGWAVAAGLWTLVCDVVLKASSRAAGCETLGLVDNLRQIRTVPEGCTGLPLAGEALSLEARAHSGAAFGIARDGLEPAMGQVVALAVVAFAAVLTIVVVRWKHRASSDPSALALVWAGAIAFAGPRLLMSTGLSELSVAGIPTGIGELALAFGTAWLAIRLLSEAVRR